ncbi:MAG: putative metallopeptidase [Candidatus Methanomethylicia archaeon]|jgi:predicted metallopeptidase|nr:putative metallopeptidase [Candidatus Methanomethylicia archaeon]
MPITYMPAEDVRELVREIVSTLSLRYINIENVLCFRSKGSRSRRGIARCHALSKIWQKALKLPPHYVIEVISERFDSLSEENKIKVIIHELLHIPKAFGGGLRPHQGYVTKRVVEEHYCRFVALSNRRYR